MGSGRIPDSAHGNCEKRTRGCTERTASSDVPGRVEIAHRAVIDLADQAREDQLRELRQQGGRVHWKGKGGMHVSSGHAKAFALFRPPTRPLLRTISVPSAWLFVAWFVQVPSLRA